MKEGHSTAGKSILEMLEEQADNKYNQYRDVDVWDVDEMAEALDNGAGENWSGDDAHSIAEYWRLRGELNAICYCIAKLRNPYKPDIAAVKREVVERCDSE